MSKEIELETNWEKDVTDLIMCDRCREWGYKEVEITEWPDNRKHWGVYCKAHYYTLMDDIAEEITDIDTSNDWDEED